MADCLHISVVFSPGPRQWREWTLQLPPGSKVADALAQIAELPGLLRAAGLPEQPERCRLGLWNHAATAQSLLRDQDRIEIYRELKVDPKVARRERFVRQGRRGAGLFAKPAVTPREGN